MTEQRLLWHFTHESLHFYIVSTIPRATPHSSATSSAPCYQLLHTHLLHDLLKRTSMSWGYSMHSATGQCPILILSGDTDNMCCLGYTQLHVRTTTHSCNNVMMLNGRHSQCSPPSCQHSFAICRWNECFQPFSFARSQSVPPPSSHPLQTLSARSQDGSCLCTWEAPNNKKVRNKNQREMMILNMCI